VPPRERDQRILDVVRALGEGEVVSYGDIADMAGFPRQSRLVGRLLAVTDDDLPWWRVVAANGRLVPGLENEQTALLSAEGVSVAAGRVRRAPHGRFRCSQP
jgi:methylated-DNA-protein-cysteine methyltransferase-like protein